MGTFGKTAAMLFAALLLFAGGIFLGGHPESLPGPLRDALVEDDRAVRTEIVDSIKDDFYKPVKDSQIDQSSLKGIVDGWVTSSPTTSPPVRRRSSSSPCAANSRASA